MWSIGTTCQSVKHVKQMSVVKRDDNMMYYTSLLQLLGISWFMSCMLISLITTIIPVEAKGSNKDPLGP